MKRLIVVIATLAFAQGLFAADVTIGTGMDTQRFPLGSHFGYERSAALYTASEMGVQSAPITHIGWLPSITTSANVPTRIYLKSTTASTLTSSTWSSMISGATLVYNKNESGLTAYAWNMLALSSSFQVNSGQNLIILVERNYGLFGSGTPGNGENGSGIRSSPVTGKHIT